MFNRTLSQKEQNLKNYFVGEKEYRPWGYFEVLDVGHAVNEEFCEKEIVVKPRHALSLQRHAMRREIWHVVEGELTAISDGEMHTLRAGESIIIPLAATHCMINMSDKKVVVRERQMGICREEDNDRLHDANGRETAPVEAHDIKALESLELYKRLIKSL